MTTLTIDPGTESADYIAFAYHNLNGVEITVEADGVVVAQATWLTDGPIFIPLVQEGMPPITPAEWVITFDTVSAVQINIMQMGVMLVTERPCQYVGHTPLTVSAKHEINPVKAINGQFLGGRIIQQGAETTFTIENLTPFWVRDYFKPFIQHAVTKPYFIAWRLDDYPGEIGYGWTNSDIRPTNQRSNGMMSVGWDFEGVIDNGLVDA